MRTFVIILIFAAGATAAAQEPRLELVAGGGMQGDGTKAAEAALNGPFAVGFGPDGSMFIAEMPGNRVRRIAPDGRMETVAGNGEAGFSGDGGPASKAQLNGPHHLLVLANGDVLIADTWNNRVRKIDAKTGVIDTIAGTGKKGFSGDGGLATDAEFSGIHCLALDESRHVLYLADLDNRRVRSVDLTTGIVSTIAGNGRKGVPKDGDDAQSAPLVDPRAVATDDQGNVYILERSGHALRVVDREGKIRTLAGTGMPGSSGDGGDARHAAFNGPKHLCVDHDGNVYVADTENHRVRVYHPSDKSIRNVAGTGKKGSAGLNGPPEAAELAQPHGVFIGPDRSLYLSDSSNNRVLKLVR
jgi:sugar lactone lactonase YvrE